MINHRRESNPESPVGFETTGVGLLGFPVWEENGQHRPPKRALIPEPPITGI